jgi:predicted ribosome quality control (RQC) complex YloA/Tae2 family protein
VGTDRIIDFEFGDGRYHLFLEFYAGGNIILTDNEHKVIALLRTVSEGSDQTEVRVGLQYSLVDKQNYNGVPSLSRDRLKDTLQKATEKEQKQQDTGNKKPKKKQADILRRAVSMGFPEYPPLLLDHCFHVTGFNSSLRPDQVLEDTAHIEKLMVVLQEAENVSYRLSTAENVPGYLIAEAETTSTATPSDPDPSRPGKLLYEDFHPFEPQQFRDRPGTTILKFDNFNKAVDEYFSSVESQKLESRLTEREETAKRKLDNAKRDHERRVDALQKVQELHVRKAQAIQANLLRVEEAITAVNGLIAQGMDWVEIARLIEMEQKRQNPVAKTIKLPLKLYENTITLLLAEPFSEDDCEDEAYVSDDEGDKSGSDRDERETDSGPAEERLLSIDIDLGLSPWANSGQYYDQRKSAAVKEEKTLKSSKKALKSTEKKIATNLKHGLKQEKPILRPTRKPFWFEKFIFFVTSEGYLVLG